ncbi:DUF6174 domain-containing protein [Nocardioides sp. GXZ039]|uniref:DUF6174 domain-containing protein n=1 Tax=Nocardioides sp. GXZ039 TaxID=3136018 RepID=UPI0030F41D37
MPRSPRLTRILTTAVAAAATVLSLASAPAVATAASRPEAAHAAAPGDGAPYVVQRFRLRASDHPRLVRAWRAWKSRDVVGYRTRVSRSCECAPEPPTRTTVRGRRVVSVTHVGQQGQLDEPGYPMENLYRVLRDGYADADYLSIRYRNGVPRRIFIDWNEALADEETILAVRVGSVRSR